MYFKIIRQQQIGLTLNYYGTFVSGLVFPKIFLGTQSCYCFVIWYHGLFLCRNGISFPLFWENVIYIWSSGAIWTDTDNIHTHNAYSELLFKRDQSREISIAEKKQSFFSLFIAARSSQASWYFICGPIFVALCDRVWESFRIYCFKTSDSLGKVLAQEGFICLAPDCFHQCMIIIIFTVTTFAATHLESNFHWITVSRSC